ncbi:hypothetical protein [Rhodococcus sp. KRD175]|uniref:hypothetical protein n=1 Tax=Rhodococcus sp. KRD175 TaxID=2729729 RepID=UPI0019CF8EF2|nr:hypothetical protein [Rhodococcus sp. KRD175]
MTDAPVTAEIVPGNRVRIAYGRSVMFSLDVGEAVDLVDAVASALAALEGIPEKTAPRAVAFALKDEPW